MTLAQWLQSRGMTYAAFGRLIGTPYAKTVSRYARFEQPPTSEMLERIFKATGGEVTPNDFFAFTRAPIEASASAEA